MKSAMNEFPMMQSHEDIVLFHPHMPQKAAANLCDVLSTRWIGQGPKVKEFEEKFNQRFGGNGASVSTGSGTDALHLAYLLCDLKPGDEVIAPLFTCTATNIPLLYHGVKIRIADIQEDTLNIDPKSVAKLINDKTRAIICVHYGGLPCDLDELEQLAKARNIPIIEDTAHALGAEYKGKLIGTISDYTMYSFQAIKHITTGDGGMLVVKNKELKAKADRVRWFGIDRQAKQDGIWANDITEIGYKYQMTDIAASLGLDGLAEFDAVLAHRQKLLALYCQELKTAAGVKMIGSDYTDRKHAAWLCTVLVEKRSDLMRKLRENQIESAQVHYRNDRYSIFKDFVESYPNMDKVEDRYLVLPLHTKLSEDDVYRVCKNIKQGW